MLWPKYWLRAVTRRMPPQRLFALVQRAVPLLLPLTRAVGRVPVVGTKLRYAVPIASYEGVFPLSDVHHREWAVLDTFDMYSPVHDHPQTARTLERWLRELPLEDVSVRRLGFLVGRGRMPESAGSRQAPA
jgi:hypothetical protein